MSFRFINFFTPKLSNSELITIYDIPSVRESRSNLLLSVPNSQGSKPHEALEVSPNGLVPKPIPPSCVSNGQRSKRPQDREVAHTSPLGVLVVLP